MAKGGNKSLGRGLGELLGEITEAYDNEVPKSDQIVEIPLDRIRPNPYQPRKLFDETALAELASSIKQHGLIQPIVVVEELDNYLLVAGERRWRACRLAELETIRAVVATLDEVQMRQHALIENIQREDLHVVELARAFEELISVHGLTHDELAQVVHKSRTFVTNTLRLLQLSEATINALREDRITAGHAKVLVGMSEAEQERLVASIVGQRLSVRETEQLVKMMKQAQQETPVKARPEAPKANMQELASLLTSQGYACQFKGTKLTVLFDDDQSVENFIKKFA